MLRYDKLTIKAQEALQEAQDIAGKAGQQQIEPLHLLAALVAQQDGVVPPLLNRLPWCYGALSASVSPCTLRVFREDARAPSKVCHTMSLVLSWVRPIRSEICVTISFLVTRWLS